MRRLDLATVRAAWWALRSARRARRQLGTTGPEGIVLPPVPPLPASAGRGVTGVLHRRRYTCLVSATVRQAWHAAHGDRRDLVIGVTAPAGGFQAHAWLDGDPECHPGAYQELVRRPAP